MPSNNSVPTTQILELLVSAGANLDAEDKNNDLAFSGSARDYW